MPQKLIKSTNKRLIRSLPHYYEIYAEYEKLSEQAFRMLKFWKQIGGSDVTYQVLHKALCHTFVGRRDLAEKFCGK